MGWMIPPRSKLGACGRARGSLQPLRALPLPRHPLQKLEFLQLFGLTTQQQKEELLTQKRRKRRRMLRERSPSPPTVQSKRRTPSPRLALSTRYSPDEMNNSPNFEEKKRFLTMFNLTHISAEKRKGERAVLSGVGQSWCRMEQCPPCCPSTRLPPQFDSHWPGGASIGFPAPWVVRPGWEQGSCVPARAAPFTLHPAPGCLALLST